MTATTHQTHGVARWISPPTPASLLCGTALLEIRPEGQKPAQYWVEAVTEDGRTVGYTLSKWEPRKGVVAVHHLDASFGGGVLLCDCQAVSRWNRRPSACRHSMSLAAALRKAGL